MMKRLTILPVMALLLACGAKTDTAATADTSAPATTKSVPVFDADSAFSYVKRQVDFGPRVNNTEAHRQTAAWLENELRRHGASVSLQPMKLKAFDGVVLDAVNIIGQYNPEAADRTLLLAHWDTRPWADSDDDESNHTTPVDGANDGASGVGVLLEVARQMAAANPGRGVDILFVDAEDRGSHDDEDSWALGAQYFVSHPFRYGYRPSRAILLDMVGGRGARFYYEIFSIQGAPDLLQQIWSIASDAGYGNIFVQAPGGGVTDDHVQFLKAGIPAIDIIEFNPASERGFNDTWHTVHDTIENIDPATLKAVGQTLLNYLYM